jgi:hypothetical protein
MRVQTREQRALHRLLQPMLVLTLVLVLVLFCLLPRRPCHSLQRQGVRPSVRRTRCAPECPCCLLLGCVTVALSLQLRPFAVLNRSNGSALLWRRHGHSYCA